MKRPMTTEKQIVFDHEKHILCELIYCVMEINGKKYEVYYDPEEKIYEKYLMGKEK